MDLTAVPKPCSFDDSSTSDVVLRLRNCEGRPEWFHSHSSLLISKSRLFADQLSNPDSGSCIEIKCSESTYDHHVNLLRLLYSPTDSLLDSLESVQSALGILQSAIVFRCEDVANCCIQYLEAVPWDGKEEEQIIKAVSKLESMLARLLCSFFVFLTETKDSCFS